MIITLSPAKLLDFETPATIKEHTTPEFEKDAEYLNNLLSSLTPDDVKSLMGINPKQAYQVYQYIQSFNMDRTSRKPAALAYNGIAYTGLQARTMKAEDWNFAQEHLVLISGLYGALRPMDLIKPYRLEAKIKLENNKGEDLYDYWSAVLTTYLINRLSADDNIWVNLASNEYSKMINKKNLPEECRVITPVFKENRDNGPKMIVVYAKKARGLMTRFIIDNKIKNAEDLKHFDVEGYVFSPSLSGKEEWVFTR